jgi:hypothetical protein
VSGKRVPFAGKPKRGVSADSWVRQGDAQDGVATPAKADVFTARLTIDVTSALRGRIKVAAFRGGVTVADMLRELLEREYPEASNA